MEKGDYVMQKILYNFKRFKGCLVCLTVLLLCGCAGESDLEITSSDAAISQESVSQGPKGSGAEPEISAAVQEPETTQILYVQVTGAVRSPGVYELPVGARVFEAVQKAGGMTDEAAAQSLNQAEEVSDGQMIVLYTTEEWEKMQEGNFAESAAGSAQSDDGRININTATLEQLCTISGIGQSRAQSIITYREQNGAFGSIEEIMKVSGIKEGLYEKIKDKIKV